MPSGKYVRRNISQAALVRWLYTLSKRALKKWLETREEGQPETAKQGSKREAKPPPDDQLGGEPGDDPGRQGPTAGPNKRTRHQSLKSSPSCLCHFSAPVASASYATWSAASTAN